MNIILIILAILPPVLLLYYVYKKDLYEKEPRSLIIKSFLFGGISIIPVVILELTFELFEFQSLLWYVLIGIAFVEEGVKFLILRYYAYTKSEFNEPYDGIVYAVAISLGFATVENIGYVFTYAPGSELTVAIIRMFSAIPLHAACGVLMGYYVGLSKFNSSKEMENFIIGLLLAILLHGLYNYFLFLGNTGYLSIIALIIGIYYAKKSIKLHQKNSPFKE